MGFNSQQGQEFLVWDLPNLLPDGTWGFYLT